MTDGLAATRAKSSNIAGLACRPECLYSRRCTRLEDKLDARNVEHGRLGKLRRMSGLFTSEQEMLCAMGVEVRSAIRRVSDRGSSRLGACRAGLRTLSIATNTAQEVSRIDGSSEVWFCCEC